MTARWSEADEQMDNDIGCFMMIFGIIFVASAFMIAVAILVLSGVVNGQAHHPQTLLIRCEQEQKGVLIGENCFSKNAVIWPSAKAPK